MSYVPRTFTAGIRFHQFISGALPAAGYLAGWLPAVYAALGLSLLAMVSDRLLIMAWLSRRLRHAAGKEDPGSRPGLRRLDEAIRTILLGLGAALLLKSHPIGWLLVLAASCIALLEATTAFSVTLLIYTAARLILRAVRLTHPHAPPVQGSDLGNPNCLVCRTLQAPPYGRCRWCRLSSIRWCCGIQTSMLLILLMVIAFLLNSRLEPAVTKLLVSMSIVGLLALSLAVSRQTDDLIGTLTTLDESHRRRERRCEYLQRLGMADSVEAAAKATVNYAAEALGVRRISVMLAEEDRLRIVASRGIPDDVAAQVAVPVPDRICGRVFASGDPVVLAETESPGPRGDPMRATGTQSPGPGGSLGLKPGGAMASYPLVAAAMQTAVRKVGVINVTDAESLHFSQEDLSELKFIAEAAGISLSSQMDRLELEQANFAAIRSLALAIEAKDTYTHGHSMRVQAWATAVAAELGVAGARLKSLAYAAELHDIGKLAIPDEVLKAPRRLTPSEWALVQEHPRRGVELVRHLTFLKPACSAILHHHERLDGAGYPDGLAGDEIPLEARIMAVVDAYDAMTSARPYRPALSHEEAAAELRRSVGTQLDGHCVDTFLTLVGEGRIVLNEAEVLAGQAG